MRDFIYGNWTLFLYIALVCVFAWDTRRAWVRYKPSENLVKSMNEPQERGMSLNSMSGATGAAVTGASITLGVIGAVVGLGRVPPDASMHMRSAAVLCGLSLLAGVWIAARLPQHANRRNVALVQEFGVALAVQVYSMFFGMLSLIVGIWAILK